MLQLQLLLHFHIKCRSLLRWGRPNTQAALCLAHLWVAFAQESSQHHPVEHALPPLQVVLDRVREEDGVDEVAVEGLDGAEGDQDPGEPDRLERGLVGVGSPGKAKLSLLKESRISRVALEEKEGFDTGQLLGGEVEGAEGGEAVAEGGESSRGAGLREEQVELLLLEAGRLEAALKEEEVWPGGADSSCLAVCGQASQGRQGPQPVTGGEEVYSCHSAELFPSRF